MQKLGRAPFGARLSFLNCHTDRAQASGAYPTLQCHTDRALASGVYLIFTPVLACVSFFLFPKHRARLHILPLPIRERGALIAFRTILSFYPRR